MPAFCHCDVMPEEINTIRRKVNLGSWFQASSEAELCFSPYGSNEVNEREKETGTSELLLEAST